MYTRRDVPTRLILRFAWRNLLVYTVWSTGVTLAHHHLMPRGIDIRIPFLPLSTIGIAVSLYLGFKNNQAYDRFWEARRLWGAITNLSRTWATQVLTFISDLGARTPIDPEELRAIHRSLVYRQIAWVNALRHQLRATTIHDRQNLNYTPDLHLPRDSDTVGDFLSPGELERAHRFANGAVHLVHRQSEELLALHRRGLLDAFHHVALSNILQQLLDAQGGSERIKTTPLPRQFATFSLTFVRIFVLLLPFGLLGEFTRLNHGNQAWLTIPFSVLISWIFATIEIVGDTSEDPFENYINDVPLSAICRNIEIDLRQLLGETEVPPKLQPVDGILL